MGFRYYRRMRIAPGIRINLTHRGVSTTLGGRYGRVTLGRKGVTPAATALPGLYYRGRTQPWSWALFVTALRVIWYLLLWGFALLAIFGSPHG